MAGNDDLLIRIRADVKDALGKIDRLTDALDETGRSGKRSAQGVDEQARASRRAAEEQARFAESIRDQLDPTRRYRQELRQLDEAYATGRLSAREYADANKMIRRDLRDAGRQAVKSTDSFSRLRNMIVGAFAVHEISRFGESLIEANRQEQRIDYTLRSVTGSAEGARKEFEYLTGLSNELGLDLQETAKGYSRVAVSAKSAGIQNQLLRKDFRGLAETFTVLHTPAEEVNGLLVQLEQGLSLGKFQMQDFRAIAQHLPGTMDLAGQAVKNMGGDLETMLANGGVPAKQFFEEFTRLLHEKYGPEAKEASHSINSELNRLHTTIFGLQTDSSGFMDSAAESVRNLNETLNDPGVRQGLESLITLLGKAASGATEAAASFGNFADGVQLDISNLNKSTPDLEDIGRYIQRLQRMRNGSALNRIGLLKGAGWDMYMSNADIDKAVAQLRDLRQTIVDRANQTSSDMQRLKILPELNGGSQTSTTPLIFREGGNNNTPKLPSAPDIKTQKAQVEAHLNLVKEQIKEEQDALNAAHQQGLVNLQKYYSRRAKLQQRSIDAEIAARREELSNEKADGGKGSQARQAKLIGEITVLQQKRAAIAQQAARDETAAEKKLADQIDQVRAKLLSEQGHTAAAAAIQVRQQYENQIRQLKANGDQDGLDLINKLINVEQAKANLQEFKQQYQRVLDDYQTKVQLIKAEVKNGQTSEADGQQRINDLYGQTVDELDPILAKMQQLAEATGNPETIHNIEKLRAQLQLTGQQSKHSFDDLNQFGVQAARNVQDALASAFQFNKLDDGLKGLVHNFADAMEQIAAQALALNLSKKLFGQGFASGKSSSMGGWVGQAGTFLSSFFHEGGTVGAGAPMSRSVPIAAFMGAPRFHNGSGVLGLKPDEVPAILQTGEQVLSRQQVAAQQAGGLGALKVLLFDDRQKILDHLAGADGERIVMQHVTRNADQVSHIIGGN